MTFKTHSKLKFCLSSTYWSVVSFGAAHLIATEAGATAIENLEKHSKTLNTLVKGPLGEAVIFIATLGGAFGAFMKGSIWLAVGIFVVGMAFVWHIDNLATVFK